MRPTEGSDADHRAGGRVLADDGWAVTLLTVEAVTWPMTLPALAWLEPGHRRGWSPWPWPERDGEGHRGALGGRGPRVGIWR